MDITNSSGATIRLDRFYATWVKSPPSQKVDRLILNLADIWNISDNDSPSDIPAESGFINSADRTIPDATTRNFVIRWLDNLEPGTYNVHIVFDLGCQVTGTFP